MKIYYVKMELVREKAVHLELKHRYLESSLESLDKKVMHCEVVFLKDHSCS